MEALFLLNREKTEERRLDKSFQIFIVDQIGQGYF